MRWLLYGSTITPAAAEALRRHGHQAQTLADAELSAELSADAPCSDILHAAHRRQLDVLTTDARLVEAAFGPKQQPFVGRCIVYLQLEGGDVEQDDAIDRLFARYKRLSPGRIYTVTGSRVKVRQLPGKK